MQHASCLAGDYHPAFIIICLSLADNTVRSPVHIPYRPHHQLFAKILIHICTFLHCFCIPVKFIEQKIFHQRIHIHQIRIMLPPLKIRGKVRDVFLALCLFHRYRIIRRMYRIFYRLYKLIRIIIQGITFLFAVIRLFDSPLTGSCCRPDKLRAFKHNRLVRIRPELRNLIIVSVQFKEKSAGYIYASGRIFRDLNSIVGNRICFAVKRYAAACNPLHILVHIIFQCILVYGLSVCFFCLCNCFGHILRKIFPVVNVYTAFLYTDISYKLIISGIFPV